MLLAKDEITLTIAGETVRLRPSLRAAMRLERHFGGFGKLLADVHEGSVTAIAFVIRETSDHPSAIPRTLDMLAGFVLTTGIEHLVGPISTLVLMLAGVDDEIETPAAVDEQPSAEPVTMSKYFQKLFEIATGWLDWTPSTAWSATPAEILAAYNGKLAMLRTIYGAPEEAKQPDFHSEHQRQAGIGALKAMQLAGANKAR